MIQTDPNLRQHLAILRRRKHWFLGAALLLLLAGVALAFGLPPVYRSQSTILIEQQEIPQDLVRSTITSFADQRVQVISQRVMTRSNLLDIIRKFNLYPEDQGREPSEVLVESMHADINMNMVSAEVVDPRSGRPTQATIAFTLSYDYPVPGIAQKVANELTTLYLNENLKNRTQMAAETSDFLSDEAVKLSGQIEELESRLASFKVANAGKLPELTDMNLQMMDRTDRELLSIEQQLRVLEERRIYLESELAQQTPHEVLYDETGARILGPADRLKMQQTRYLSLSAVYGEGHPDVIRLRKEVDALMKEVGQPGEPNELRDGELASLQSELALARENYSADHPDVKRLEKRITAMSEHARQATPEGASSGSNNPAYIELQTRLEAANTEVRSLTEQRGKLRVKLAEYESRLVETPQIEKEYRALMRDYENTMVRYRETRAKLMEAQLSKSLEAERKGERFTLIEPPMLPERPLKPNRVAILVMGVILALLGGFGAAYAKEKLDDAVWGGEAGIDFGVTAPLLIPYINTEADLRRRTLRHRFGFALAALLVVSSVLAVHLFHSPLDVLWYTMARRIGI
jgi:succinoglycan biosynthesis transport protein ExoP